MFTASLLQRRFSEMISACDLNHICELQIKNTNQGDLSGSDVKQLEQLQRKDALVFLLVHQYCITPNLTKTRL